MFEVCSTHGDVLAKAAREARADYAGLTYRYCRLIARKFKLIYTDASGPIYIVNRTAVRILAAFLPPSTGAEGEEEEGEEATAAAAAGGAKTGRAAGGSDGQSGAEPAEASAAAGETDGQSGAAPAGATSGEGRAQTEGLHDRIGPEPRGGGWKTEVVVAIKEKAVMTETESAIDPP